MTISRTGVIPAEPCSGATFEVSMNHRVERIDSKQCGGLQPSDALLYAKRGGGEKRIPSGRWWINKNTPVGDEAELWERMSHEGRRLLDWKKLLGVERVVDL